MIKKFSSLTTVLILALFFSYPEANAQSDKEILVSAAISLKNPFEKIGKLFEARHKGLKVLFNFGGSGSLARQIEGSAPVDVFASASQKDMDDLSSKGYILSDSRTDFAGNTVVLIKSVKFPVPLESFKDLTSREVKRIAIGNPTTVPAGRYAMEVLAYYRINDLLKDKYVLAENVRQVIDYVARGEVDAGISYSTDVSGMEKEITVVKTAPEDSHKPAIYPIAVIKGSKNEGAAREFIKAVVSDQGKEILKKFGFRAIKAVK